MTVIRSVKCFRGVSEVNPVTWHSTAAQQVMLVMKKEKE
jgi:hypothetical protein